jgi:hypothetical protein
MPLLDLTRQRRNLARIAPLLRLDHQKNVVLRSLPESVRDRIDMTESSGDAGQAARLIGMALRLRLDTSQDAEYRALAARYESSVSFRRLTAEIAAGLGLTVSGMRGDPERGKLVVRPSGPGQSVHRPGADFTDSARG